MKKSGQMQIKMSMAIDMKLDTFTEGKEEFHSTVYMLSDATRPTSKKTSM